MMILDVLFISFVTLHLLTLLLCFIRFYFVSRDAKDRANLQKLLDSDVTFLTLESLSSSTKYAAIFLALAVLINIFRSF